MLSTYLQGQDKELLEFGELDVSLKGVKVINHLSLSAHFISHLYLDGNHLLSLTGIEQFHNLEVLHFDYNYVSLPSEVNKITNPFFMREISFIGNPIQSRSELSLQKLRHQGFSRLVLLNPPHPLSKFSHEVVHDRGQIGEKEEQSIEITKNNPEQTTRRNPAYRLQEPSTLRKRMVGKIYSNRKMKTIRQQKTREQSLSRETKESNRFSSSRDSPSAVSLGKKGVQDISPFEYYPKPSEEISQEEEQSQDYKSRQGTARFQHSEKKPSFSEQFLSEEKQRLASYYYNRVLLQKSIRGFLFQRDLQAHEVEEFEGELINDYLQTLHYSLIKLKQEAFRR